MPEIVPGRDAFSPVPFPRFGDVAHLGHVELFTPKPAESLAFFTSIVGLHEAGRSGDSVYLRLEARGISGRWIEDDTRIGSR